jgi:N-acetylglucosamine-6-phosphate deacetylase
MTKSTIPAIALTRQIVNARIPGYSGLQSILIDSRGIIQAIAPVESVDLETQLLTLDVAGDWVSLGGIDLQINGGLGLAFPDLNQENCQQLPAIAEFLWNQGVDGFVPTLVTTSVENIQRSLSILAEYISQQPVGIAQVLGVHLEGPFLNFQKRGAHPAEYLLPLTIENLKVVLGDFAGIVKIVTLAPELDPAGITIPYLRSLGITVSLGHSQATAAEAAQAFKLGATMVTHAFNAMPSLHHREPGLLGAAIINPHVQSGFIADGQHVAPTMLQILLRATENNNGLFLVSDALAPLGLPDGVYPWDSRQIEVKHGTARLLDGTLSGTTLPLLVGVENLVQWGICNPERAIALATEAPREALNLPGIGINQPSNLLRWQFQENTQKLTWQRLSLEGGFIQVIGED